MHPEGRKFSELRLLLSDTATSAISIRCGERDRGKRKEERKAFAFSLSFYLITSILAHSPLFLSHHSSLSSHPFINHHLAFSHHWHIHHSIIHSSLSPSLSLTLHSFHQHNMKPTLLLLGALALVASTASSAKPPLPQDHDNHHYYTVKINDLAATSPQEIARHLGVQYIGQVGELQNYHLFSYPKVDFEKRSLASTSPLEERASGQVEQQHDVVLKRYEQFKASSLFTRHLQRKRSLSGEASTTTTDAHPLGDINRQVLRQRVKRAMIPLEPRDEHVKGDTQPADGVAAHFQIKDPGFQYQWHLVGFLFLVSVGLFFF